MFNFIKKLFYPKQKMLARSSKWPKTRGTHLEKEPTCQACGGVKDLSVHHIVPYHIDKDKELDPENLITLCEHNHCHFFCGHLFFWESYNPKVREDAAAWLIKVQKRP
jgi:hypothetical protein